MNDESRLGPWRLKIIPMRLTVWFLLAAATAIPCAAQTRPRGRDLGIPFPGQTGPVTVKRTATGYVMDFPVRPSEPVSTPAGLAEALGAVPVEVFVNEFNYMAVLESPQVLRDLAPEMTALARMDRTGVIVTAPEDGAYDFVSRYFAPAKGIPEDPVTGAAHCMLAPYWAQRLNQTEFHAFQASKRGGEIICRLVNNRIELEGNCVFYLEGYVEI
jgi:predicted PhzF superfamily epimerase YddE/YHI9